MAIDPTKLNFLNPALMQAQQPVNPIQHVTKNPTEEVESSRSKNPFSSQTTASTMGLNKLQTGDNVYTPAQAGKKPGSSRIIGYA
jgi:hypothetical protein